ncbi:hypothetical protein HYDPIDRAFT_110816 [Hydnomerulius pinastri MD-312]|nr:hypothetical protein HYDPIDRAFT_110816 [Hydnomerulius pinastri MD-312]
MPHQPMKVGLTIGGPLATSLSEPAAVNQAQSRIDDEIAALNMTISGLRTRRNSLSPISRIPPEMLAVVFVHYARDHHADSRAMGSRSLPPWVNVSYVSRHWRDVALSCPTLWTYLFFMSRAWTEELLSRSKMAPLKIHADLYYSGLRSLDSVEKAMKLVERIQVVNLKLLKDAATKLLPQLTSPAPLLQSLQLTVATPGSLDRHPLILDSLFNGEAPALRKLELYNCHVPWTSPILSGLTNLRLRQLASTCQPTIAELRSVLRRMPRLVDLHLENALPSNSVPSTYDTDSEILELPHLSRLSLIASVSAIVALLSNLHIPLTTDVRLQCTRRASDCSHSDLYSLLAKRFSPDTRRNQPYVPPPVIQTLNIESTAVGVSFVFSTSARAYDRRPFSAYAATYLCEDWACGIPLKIDIDYPSSIFGMGQESIIGGVCRSVALTHLRSLSICFDTGVTLSQTFWKETFGHLQDLHSIKLKDASIHGLVPALSPDAHHGAENDNGSSSQNPHQIFAPALAELELISVEFAEECYGRIKEKSDTCTASAMCLYDALSRRKARGYTLKKLAIEDSMYVFETDVEKLTEVVTEMDWDEVTRTVDDEEDYDEDEEDEEDDDYDDDDDYALGYFGHW